MAIAGVEQVATLMAIWRCHPAHSRQALATMTLRYDPASRASYVYLVCYVALAASTVYGGP